MDLPIRTRINAWLARCTSRAIALMLRRLVLSSSEPRRIWLASAGVDVEWLVRG